MKLKNITEPYSGCFQVRIKRKGKLFTQTFNKTDYPERKKALAAAIKWRDEKNKAIDEINRIKERPVKTKTGIIGISERIKTFDGAEYLRFVVSYRDLNGKPATKEFSAGRIEQIFLKPRREIVFKIALLFRLEYELHRENPKYAHFNPQDYKEHKNLSEEWILNRFKKIGVTPDEVSKQYQAYLKRTQIQTS